MGTNVEFELKEDYIELYKLLKASRLAPSGGIAKLMIEEGEVFLNGNLELRKRAKIKAGDKITFQNQTILVK